MFTKVLKREYVELIRESERLDVLRKYLEGQDGSYVDIEPLLAIVGCSCQKREKDDV